MKDYFILKSACRTIYVAGGGDFWFEDGAVGNESRIMYKVYAITLLMIYTLMTVMEIIAAVFGDFPDDEKGDAVTFAFSHTIVLSKFCSLVFRKRMVKGLIKDLIEVCSDHEDDKKMAAKAKVIKLNVIGNYILVYGSAIFYVSEGLRKVLSGNHFVTIVTCWPTFENNTAPATAFRIFCTVVLHVMMVPMICFDCLVVTVLIILKYKFITLRGYFDKLTEEFEMIEKNESTVRASENLWHRMVEGIIMHQKLLRIFKTTATSFSFLIAMQVLLGIASDVWLLLQLALIPDLSFVSQLKMVLFIIALLFLLAMFLCNAGEITYQASLLADSVFYSGWQLSRLDARRSIGRLVLFTCTLAHKPRIIKAFNMLHITYGTFLSVVRTMYSVFALIKSKNM